MTKNQIIVVIIVVLLSVLIYNISTNDVQQPLPSTLVDPKHIMIPVNPETQAPVQQTDIVTVVQN